MEAQVLYRALASANTKLEHERSFLSVKCQDFGEQSERSLRVETTRLQSKLEAASNESVLRLAGRKTPVKDFKNKCLR
jgi:hypothetical protein